jgi:hypothetical protein
MPHPTSRRIRTAARAVLAGWLSLSLLFALVLPASAAATMAGMAAPGGCAEYACASICQPAMPPGEADEQVSPFHPEPAHAQGVKRAMPAYEPALLNGRFIEHSGQSLYLRYLRLLL